VEIETGVMVQVGEQVGVSETDLRPILERPRKHVGEAEEERGGGAVERAEASRTVRLTMSGNTAPSAQRPMELLRHKSLNALLGTPKGALGKATLPAKSPYELKNGTAGEEGRAAKRQRTDAQATWMVTRVTTPRQAMKSKEAQLWTRTADARAKRASATQPSKATRMSAGQRSLKVREVIDITSDNEENTTSDITLPDTTPASKTKRTPAVPRSWRRDSPPPFDPPLEPRSPPVSTRNKIINVDADTPPGTVDITDIDRRTSQGPPPQNSSRLKPIQLARSKPRNMLLCEKNNPKIMKTKSTSTTNSLPLGGVNDGPQAEKRSERANQRQRSEKDPRDEQTTISESRRQQTGPAIASIRDDGISSPAFSALTNARVLTRKSTANITPRARTEEQTVPMPDPIGQQLLPVREFPNRATGQATVRPAVASKSSENRIFGRVQSENDATVAFPPDGFSGAPRVNEEHTVASSESLPAAKHATKKPMRQSTSENNGVRKQAGSRAQASVVLSEQPETKQKDQEKGPWTIEALDFYDWRPPDWDARVKQKALELEG